ncbi:hypothetical protein H6P81_000860 [Aristolochia fimbriata]|uniref:Protein KAKU4 n=1 Tax=Aristolochia fimbriata TaxID=158543 RepID=A0AAV7F5F1_ARIFI|nr:hypothetical protein H6P81_000860 [Aristolochia fimbriata]
MAAISSPRPLSPPGSGGKIRRARRFFPETSPYARPPLGSGPSSPPDSPKRGWLFTAVRSVASTAGKLLSVLRSESPSSSSGSSSTSSSSDGNGDEYGDVNGLCRECSKNADDLYTNGNLPVATPSSEKVPQLITQDRSKTKLAIEYLLMQETYTREECMKLTKIIQSRVVDTPITEEENRWSIVSPKSSLLHAGSPDVYQTAIIEAKNWLQEKKSEINSKSNVDQEPCTLTTDLLSYPNERETGSPVDLAKSYMQSRPPWASPLLLNVKMKSPSPIQLNFSDDETQHAVSHYSPSLKAAKKSSGFVGSSSIHEEVRRVRLKLAESISESSMLKQNEASPQLLANVSGKTSQVACDRLQLDGISHKSDSAQVDNAVTGSEILPPRLEVDNAGSEDTIRSSLGNDVEQNFVVTDVVNGNPSSPNVLSKCGEGAVAEKYGDELRAACPTFSLQDNNQELGDAYLCQEKGGSGTKSTVPTSVPTGIIEATVGEPINRETLPSEEIGCSMTRDSDHGDKGDDAAKASSEMCSAAEKVVDGVDEPVKGSCFADASSLPDLKQQQAFDPMQNGSSNKTEAGESSGSSRSSVPVEPNAKPGGRTSKKSQKKNRMRPVVTGPESSQQVHELQSDDSKQAPSDVERNDIEAESRARTRMNAPEGHANGNRRAEVGYKRRRVSGK